MSAEAKVGAFTLGGLLLLLVSILGLEGFHPGGQNGYTVYVGFRQVVGLTEQAEVCLSGVPVGTVTGISNDGGGVMITLQIRPDVRIPRDAGVTLASSGVMGEKFVNILPGRDRGDYLSEGDYLFGTDEAGMDAMFASMNRTMEQAQELLASMNNIIGDPVFRNSLVEMSVNIKNASAHMSGTLAAVERMAVGSEASVQQAARELPLILASMERTMASVEHMMANMDSVAGDPQVAENLRVTLENLSQTSQRVEHIAANMDGVLGDPQTAEDIRATVRNARSLTERADQMLEGVSGIEVKPGIDVLYSGGARNWDTNFDLEVGKPESAYLRLGAEDIGDENRFNAQVGKRFGSLGARAGVIAGKPGIGLDAYAGDKWKFSAEAYNLNDGAVRLRAQYRITGGTHLVGQWNDVNDSDKRRAYVGVRQEF